MNIPVLTRSTLSLNCRISILIKSNHGIGYMFHSPLHQDDLNGQLSKFNKNIQKNYPHITHLK